MARYLLSIYQPDGPPPPPEVLGGVMREVGALTDDMKAKGAWVFMGGLHPPETATVVRLERAEFLTTDGPFVEAKEHIGGFLVIEAADLDEALGYAKRVPLARWGWVEVRPARQSCGDSA
jgi:hypothetical protein